MLDRDARGDHHDLGAEQLHTLADGGRVLVRALRPSDSDEMALAYEKLSPASRRLRFFNAPKHLSERLLDYLTDLDGVNRFALGAQMIDEHATPGVGVARYVRNRNDPTKAEAAATVLDSHRHRGIATILLAALVEAAVSNGITTFTANVMWENTALLDALRKQGATIEPDEPGVAAVSLELPRQPEAFVGSMLYRLLRTVASGVLTKTT